MTEDKIQRLRDAGISEDVIIDMMKKPEEGRSEGYIDPAAPSSTFTQAQAAGAPIAGPETSMTQLATEATTLIPDALKYGGLAAGGVGIYKYGKGLANRVMNPPYTPPAGGSANSPGRPGVPMPTQPVAPAIEPGGQKVVDFAKQQGQFKQPGIVQQGMDMARRMQEIAASRVAPVAQALAPVARAATGVGAALMPGNMGQAYPFPQTGPMQGQEINPNTGRPWTPAELQQYNAQFQ
jgi:hypothetical protein